jgi:hypothetical protein
MATTTPNFGWAVPTSTDLVKDGAVAIETLGDSIDASLVDLKGGTTGQVLAKASNTDMDFSWVAQDDSNAIQNAIVDAKGDLIAATAADTPARLAVGANDTILMADSTAATGLKWAGSYSSFTPTVTAGSGSFTSVNATSRYLVIGKMCHWIGRVNIVTVGTASGGIVLTLPVTRAGGLNVVGYAEETAAVGFQAFIFINAADGATILKGDYSSAIGAGRGIDFNVTYEVA